MLEDRRPCSHLVLRRAAPPRAARPAPTAAGPQAGRGPVESQSGRNTPGPVAAGESPVSSGLVDPDEVEPSPAAAAFI